MFYKIKDWCYKKAQKKIRDSLPKIDWRSLYSQLEEITKEHSVYVETRHNGMFSIGSDEISTPPSDIIALVVTPAKSGVDPWDTESPAKALVDAISKKTGKPCALLISRDYSKFVGYYAYIR